MKLKEISVLYWIVGFFLFLFLFTLVSGLLLKILNQTTIDWAEFVNILFNFSLEVTSLAIAFLLGQVYWNQHNKRQKYGKYQRIFRSYLDRILIISRATYNLMDPGSTADDANTVDENRKIAVKNISILHGLGNVFFDLFSASDLDLPEYMLEEFINNIKPEIDYLAHFTNIAGHTVEINQHLRKIIENCESLYVHIDEKEREL